MIEIEFLNVDLEIESAKDIAFIVEGLQGRLSVLNYEYTDSKYSAIFETGYGELNKIVEKYSKAINSLNAEARKAWDNCTKRVFDIGFDSGEQQNIFVSEISPSSLRSIHDVGGTIFITIYGSSNDNI